MCPVLRPSLKHSRYSTPVCVALASGCAYNGYGRTYVCAHVYAYICMYIHVSVPTTKYSMCVHTYVQYICTYVSVWCMYVCMYVCMSVLCCTSLLMIVFCARLSDCSTNLGSLCSICVTLHIVMDFLTSGSIRLDFQ